MFISFASLSVSLYISFWYPQCKFPDHKVFTPTIGHGLHEYFQNLKKSLESIVQSNMRFEERVDRTHIIVASAILHSMSCGWIAQEMMDKRQANFAEENFQDLDSITHAYEAGRRYANETPTM